MFDVYPALNMAHQDVLKQHDVLPECAPEGAARVDHVSGQEGLSFGF